MLVSDVQWYYARDDEQFGPISGAELRSLAAAGELTRDNLVWREGMSEWSAAGKMRGLFPELRELGPDAAAATAAGPSSGRGPAAAAVPVAAGSRGVPLVLALFQGLLWGICALIVFLGGISFTLDYLRARGEAQQAATAAVFTTYFVGAYVIARAGEKIAQLLSSGSPRK